jgi:EAL and modified HD-GYP domain-containing signal transduction protein
MVAMGEKDLRRLLLLAVLTGAAADKPHELTQTALSRGRLCESLAALSGMGVRASEGFLMGMFSLLDAMMGRPIQELAVELGLAPEVRAALTGEAPPGSPFAGIYKLCLACEAVDGSAIEQLCGNLGYSVADIEAMHLEAISWSDTVLRTESTAVL